MKASHTRTLKRELQREGVGSRFRASRRLESSVVTCAHGARMFVGWDSVPTGSGRRPNLLGCGRAALVQTDGNLGQRFTQTLDALIGDLRLGQHQKFQPRQGL